MTEFTITATTEHIYREGWGVSVMPIWSGSENWSMIEHERVY